jgi:regulator of sirC expression with transglutaminase-like and TPR domain
MGGSGKLQLEHLRAASTRSILVRVLMNLKAAHLARGDLSHALVAAARIATLSPRDPWALRDRGLLQAQLGAHEGARADLRRYLELSPEGRDDDAVKQVLARLEGKRAAMN